jgi:hypothetical protein
MKTKSFFLLLLLISIVLASGIVGNAQRTSKITTRKSTKTSKPINLSVEQSIYIKDIIRQAKAIDDGYIVYIKSADVDNLFGGAMEDFPRIRTVELPEPFQDEIDFLIKIVSGWRELHQLLTWKRNTLNAVQYQTQLDSLLDEYKMTGMPSVKAFNAFRQIANNSRLKLDKMFAPYSKSAFVETNPLQKKNSIQISNLSKFISIFDKVATSLEENDQKAKSGKLSQEAINKNAQYKRTVIKSIGDIRSGILSLEKEISVNPSMKNNQTLIKELSNLSNLAKAQAEAGKFTDSKITLSTLLDKLTVISGMLP